MHACSSLLLAFASLLPAVAADRKPAAEPRSWARAVAPFLDEQAIAVVHLDGTRLNPKVLRETLARATKMPAEDLRDFDRRPLQWLKRFTGAGGKDFYVIFSLEDLRRGREPFVLAPLARGADAGALAQLLGTGMEVGIKLPDKPMVFGGSREALDRVKALKAAPRPNLEKAFAAAGDTTVQGLILPSADTRRVLEEVLDRWPAGEGGSGKVISRGVQWAALGANVSPRLSLRLVIQSKDAKSAKTFHDLLIRLSRLVSRQVEPGGPLPDADKMLAPLIPGVNGDRLTLRLDERQLGSVLVPVIQRLRMAAARAQSSNNLRQIGIALHSYHDAHKAFPAAASYDKQGKPLLSWRVHLLPFLDEEKLYKEFHLDEPWDSAHNKKLIARMPRVYYSPDSRRLNKGLTRYLAPVGKGTMFPGRKGLRIADVTDGTSNTIFIVEAADNAAVVWTKPEDLKVDPKHPPRHLVGKGRKGFLALFVDASVRHIPATIKPQTLAALFTPSGGEVIGRDGP
jgi:hypothetical protein